MIFASVFFAFFEVVGCWMRGYGDAGCGRVLGVEASLRGGGVGWNLECWSLEERIGGLGGLIIGEGMEEQRIGKREIGRELYDIVIWRIVRRSCV